MCHLNMSYSDTHCSPFFTVILENWNFIADIGQMDDLIRGYFWDGYTNAEIISLLQGHSIAIRYVTVHCLT